MKQSRIQAVDHVRLEAPFGVEEALHWFYSEVVQLQAVPGDPTGDFGMCFESEGLELRIRISDCPAIEPVASRVTILVPCLADVAALLEERGIGYERESGLTYTERRLAVRDPAGNRVELKQEWPFEAL